MTQLSIAEIRSRAMAFAKEFASESSEDAEAKTFWDRFFDVFGVSRRRLASFELPVKKGDGKGGFIDLLWKGQLLVEHKSRGRDLDSAYGQARDYFAGLKDRDLPRYVIVSDFERFRLYDLDESVQHDFTLASLHHYVHLFGFMTGRQVRAYGKQNAVNQKAVEQLGALHNAMRDSGYRDHQLEVFLIRLLFCLFSEDNGIFERGEFRDYIESRTREDGSDLDGWLGKLFHTLNTPEDKRQRNLPEDLKSFPYVNGRLFAEQLPPAQFDRQMREALLDCAGLDWSRISPEIFGALFQSVMNRQERRGGGKHYTSENNIRKALDPLFLDALRAEFESVKRNRQRLAAFQRKLAGIKILDPACGCGNFLVVAYRELRRLELEVLRVLYRDAGSTRGDMIDIGLIVQVDVHQMYGIEIDEWPAQIAQVALWLTDHQMNLVVSEEFGQGFVRIPLRSSPNIVCGNALTVPWSDVIAPGDCSFVVGNPPFVGGKLMSDEQRQESGVVLAELESSGLLDYVSCWFVLAARYMLAAPEQSRPRVALVSTNSITQGEQVGVLWGWMLRQGIKLHFAHRTFSWSSEARGKAAVHCVIIGFGVGDAGVTKVIYEYDDPRGEPHAVPAANVNPYLVDYDDLVLLGRSKPLCDVPEIGIGNQPIDDGQYLFTPQQKVEFLALEPQAEPFFRLWMGTDEFLYGTERWCLWLGDATPAQLRAMPHAMRRVEAVKAFRLKSKRKPTLKLALTPRRFQVENMPVGNWMAITETSSESRRYVPLGFEGPEVMASNLLKVMPDATLYHFGVLSSLMHNVWTAYTCGRLESRLRYSIGIVYNNFPWPQPTEAQRQAIAAAAQAVLDTRAQTPDSSLADMYDPAAMPAELLRAHQRLDRAVDTAYGRTRFAKDSERVAFLFDRYRERVQAVQAAVPAKAAKPRRVRNTD
jgi:hypothetical protein